MTSSAGPIEYPLSNKRLANLDLLFVHYKSRKYSVYLTEHDLAVCPIHIPCYNQDSLITRCHICTIYWCVIDALYLVNLYGQLVSDAAWTVCKTQNLLPLPGFEPLPVN